MFDHFHDLVPLHTILPRDEAVRLMLPKRVPAFWEKWIEVHGRWKTSVLPNAPMVPPAPSEPAGVAHPEQSVAPAQEPPAESNAFVHQLRDMLAPALTVGAEISEGWQLHNIEPCFDDPGALLEFVSMHDERRMMLWVAPRDDEKPAFARTARFNVSYLLDSGKTRQVYQMDMPLLNFLVDVVHTRERQSNP